jgi:hypothetical protein
VEGKTLPKFRKKPVVVEAVQFDHSPQSALDVIEWAKQYGVTIICRHDGMESHEVVIPTLEGDMTASPGDWVIRGVRGEFYPCKPDIFAATYESADPQ